MKKLVFVGKFPEDSSKSVTGPANVLYNLVRSLSTLGKYDIIILDIFSLRKSLKSSETQKLDHNVTVIRTNCLGALSFLCKNNCQINYVNIHSPAPVYMIPFLVPNRKFEIMYTAHGLASRELKLGAPYGWHFMLTERWVLKHSNVIFCVSNLIKKLIKLDYGAINNRIIVIPNGVPKDLGVRRISSKLFTDKYPKLKGTKFIIFAGGTRRLKGIRFLLKAFIEIEDDDLKLLIMGKKGDYYNDMHAEYSTLIGTKIIDLGEVNHELLLSAFKNCLFVTHLSSLDSFGLVPLEAMALGIPVVVSNKVGMSDLIITGKNGFVVNYEDNLGLRSVIKKLVSSSDLRKKIGVESKNIITKYNWDSIAKEYAGHLR
jgi:glycosyltransferase involved in cell wall biosynthesis